MLRKSFDYSVLVLFIALMLIGGCARENPDTSSDGISEPKTKVRAIPVKRGNLSVCLSLTGTMNPSQEVKVTSKLPGRVEKVFVDQGDQVKAGAPLIQLEQEELVLGVKQAEAALASGEAHLADTQSDYERMKNLYEEKSIPGQRWEKTQAALKVAEAQVEQARAAVALAKKQLDNATIRSPIDGIVTKKCVEPGEVVSPPVMPGMPLLRVMKLDNLKTKVNISEKRIDQISVGQEAEINVDGLPDKTFRGKISRIAPVVDPQSRTLEIEIDIPNPELRLKAGMFARVKIILEDRSDILLLPVKAVLSKGKEKIVFLAENGLAKKRQVDVGLTDGINVEILSGVEEGEVAIVQGNLGLENDTGITVESTPSPGK